MLRYPPENGKTTLEIPVATFLGGWDLGADLVRGKVLEEQVDGWDDHGRGDGVFGRYDQRCADRHSKPARFLILRILRRTVFHRAIRNPIPLRSPECVRTTSMGYWESGREYSSEGIRRRVYLNVYPSSHLARVGTDFAVPAV